MRFISLKHFVLKLYSALWTTSTSTVCRMLDALERINLGCGEDSWTMLEEFHHVLSSVISERNIMWLSSGIQALDKSDRFHRKAIIFHGQRRVEKSRDKQGSQPQTTEFSPRNLIFVFLLNT